MIDYKYCKSCGGILELVSEESEDPVPVITYYYECRNCDRRIPMPHDLTPKEIEAKRAAEEKSRIDSEMFNDEAFAQAEGSTK